MSDQNQFDQYKQKLLHAWGVFLAAWGRFWENVKINVKKAAEFTGRNAKVLAQNLAAYTAKARAWLKKAWSGLRRYGKRLLQMPAAWALLAREKLQPVRQRIGTGVDSVKARIRSMKPEAAAALPPAEVAQEAPALTQDVPAEPEAPAIEVRPASVPETAKQDPEPAAYEKITNPYLAKTVMVVGIIGKVLKLIIKWIWKLRTIIMAVPVVWAAVKLAMQNAERLPEQVGLDIQSTGAFARMITREEAVYWPLGITLFCLLLMFCSKKPLLPWVISIFTLVLPWLIWLLNYYA